MRAYLGAHRFITLFYRKLTDMATLTPDQDPVIRAQAWVGDAILALYVREWILSFNDGAIDGKLFIEFTSNNFLRLIGNATGVEAQIGRVFKQGGLEAAYAWIDLNLRERMEQRLHILRSRHPHHRK